MRGGGAATKAMQYEDTVIRYFREVWYEFVLIRAVHPCVEFLSESE